MYAETGRKASCGIYHLAVGAELREDMVHHELIDNAAVLSKSLWAALLIDALGEVIDDDKRRCIMCCNAELFAAVCVVHVQK